MYALQLRRPLRRQLPLALPRLRYGLLTRLHLALERRVLRLRPGESLVQTRSLFPELLENHYS